MKLKLSIFLLACTIVFTGCGSNAGEKNKRAQKKAADNAASETVVSKEDWAPILDSYRKFTIEQADTFIIETEKFVTAVKGGDIETAKQLYAPTRMYYERIEPIAEALGDLDPNIDAREN